MGKFTYTDHVNKDALYDIGSWLQLTENWTDPYPDPVIQTHDGIQVVRDDLIVGTKARAAHRLFQDVKEDTVVYVQPREGAAGVSLIEAANAANKKVKFFMPASKRMSETQALVIERGADYEFHRIAAMPNLNRMAEQWALQNNAFFIPLGLKHSLVTAALVRVGHNLRMNGFNPTTMAVATSTGTLIRALQIAFPDTTFHSVAVARNLQAGEKGPATFYSDTRPFLTDTKFVCPFPSYQNYDAKAWEYCVNNGIEAMWNVASKPSLIDKTIPDQIDSYRDWPPKKEK